MTEYTKYKLGKPLDELEQALKLIKDYSKRYEALGYDGNSVVIQANAFDLAMGKLKDTIEQLKKLGGDLNEN